MVYFSHIPKLLQKAFPQFLWRINDPPENQIYLTFDDGPCPHTTPMVLDLLSQYQAKATFFCIGREVEKHPQIFKRIQQEGHSIGNHSYSHFKGWQTETQTYLNDIKRCKEIFPASLYRPPYGELKPSQWKALLSDPTKYFAAEKSNSQIVFWDVLSGDFNLSFSKEKCLNIVLESSFSGSIVVFHDKQKCAEKLEWILPKVLEHYNNLNYKFLKL